MIGLSINWNVDSQNLKKTIEDWSKLNIWLLMKYQISMVDCTMLPKIYLKLQNLESSPCQPFDGLNIIFVRDFVQFPLVSGTLLYTINIKPNFFNEKNLKFISRVYLKFL